MAMIYIGTSGWYYPGWSGLFYPADLPQSEWLAFYAREFPTVEINATFYRLPPEPMIAGWHRKAPKGFVYAVKGSRRITHIKRLIDSQHEINLFVERVSGLKAHLGPVLWQLPPNLSKDTERLFRFLACLPASLQHAVEFRHPSWLTDEIFEILRARRMALVIVSSLKMPADFTVTADFTYLRFHGLAGGFAHDYSHDELRPFANHIQRCRRQGIDVYAYFNNDAQARAPKNARELTQLVERG